MDDAGSAAACRAENSAGQIPVILRLAAGEASTSEEAGAGPLSPPPPFYAMAPRLACLPSLAGRARAFFKAHLPPGADGDPPWFSADDGAPLRCHIPAGVLHDLAVPPSSPPSPWPLTIHFTGFPAEALVRWPGPDPGRSAFLNALKEAACAAAGSAGGVLAAPVPARDAVWAAAQAGDAAGAWAASAAMVLGEGAGGSGQDSRPPCFPLRLFVSFGEGALPPRVAYTSRPVAATPGRTLGEALLEALPKAAGGWSLVEEEGEGGAAPVLALAKKPVAAVLTVGVPAPLAAPAAWAAAALGACDRFLYVVVRV